MGGVGFVPLRDYAAIGDGRTVALVSRDGSVDWLPVPDLDSGTVFAAVLDPQRGGRFVLAPAADYRVQRRYLPGTNVLETTYLTAQGAVRVTDAMTLPGPALLPGRELVRRVEGLSGSVPLRWSVTPRFGYAGKMPRMTSRHGVPVAASGADAVAVSSWQAGEVARTDHEISARFEVRAGERSLVALSFTHQEPLVLPTRAECETRLSRTVTAWREWSHAHTYPGPWSQAVDRSALALKLLVFAPSGAVAAAGTSSLPEQIGGVRNWDYRYSWVRDSAFTVDTFLALGCRQEAHAYFWWLMHASATTHPKLRVLYRLDGGTHAPERVLALSGYEESAPVRIGNAARDQRQLDTYGELMQTAWRYALATGHLDADIARRLAGVADLVCRLWRAPDLGIWEVRSEAEHFTQSKMMCAVALDRAVRLAERGLLPGRHLARWRREQRAVREFVEDRCYREDRRSYVRAPGSSNPDASLLLGLLHGYAEPQQPRLRDTVRAVGRELAEGAYVYRYRGDGDGLPGGEGAFVACSFWLVESLARTGRVEQAADLMDQLVPLANDVGLYSEEIDPASGAFLGNLPQALSHLSLIGAARALHAATGGAGDGSGQDGSGERQGW